MATGKTVASEEVKYAIFLHFAGLNALDVFEMLIFNEDSDDKKLGKLLEKFKAYCILHRSIM